MRERYVNNKASSTANDANIVRSTLTQPCNDSNNIKGVVKQRPYRDNKFRRLLLLVINIMPTVASD